MGKVKLIDVANKAGVSKSTVSQFLNNRYEFMSKETRKRIEKAVDELGYKPNALARSLKMKRTNTVGVIVSNIMQYYSTTVSRGIEDYCSQHKYNVILCNTDNNPEKEKEYINILRMRQVDGIIIASTGKNNDLLKKEFDENYPIVLIDREYDELGMNTVVTDNRKGSFLAVEHLIRIGHTRIGIISYELKNIQSRKERLIGYKEALQKYGIDQNENLVKYIRKGKEQIDLEQLKNMKNPPTALVTMNGTATIQLLTYLQRKKIKVPEDIAVVGFDELPMSHLLETPLTVVKQQTYDIGQKAASLLIEQIEGDERGKSRKEILPCELIIRDSCGLNSKNNKI